ncbi:uncharacterized protein LOC134536950 isoform X2 [Bacillus rossius redtenbacheri]|uniref:uncharacterized protein LOC134536950 isoform X2 n=1 Tax=Bacillus rossius redtenbacheri TaxID=93214 RepID=UPI002FDE14F0
MQYGLAQLLAGIAATMAAVVSGEEEAVVTVGTKRLQHVVSDRFLSLTVDPAILLDAARTSSESLQMLAMARTLAPAFLRVAGPDSNHYRFQKDVAPDRSALSADYTVTELQWVVLNEFARQAGLHLVAALGTSDREEDGAWSSRNSLELVSLSDRLGYNVSWQLGYELQELRQAGEEGEEEGEEEGVLSGSRLGRDAVQLRRMLDVFPRYRRSLLLAPDVTRFSARRDALFLKGFFGEASGALSAVTWHPSGFENSGEAELLMDALDWDGSALRKSIGRAFNKKPLWIAESERDGGSQGRFKDALAWGQHLGAAAQLGADVLLKKLGVPIMSQPSPEYWASVLHKSLVGRAVLDARLSQGNGTHLRLYAHCAAERSRGGATPSYERGAVTVFGVSYLDGSASLALKATSWGRGPGGEEEVHQYVLTAPDLDSRDVLLNGQPLQLNPDGSLPIVVPTIHHTDQSITVTIPPNSIGFWVIPNAKVRPCMAPVTGKMLDFEDLAAVHDWENSDLANSEIGGLRRQRRKHNVRPRLGALNSRRRENKEKPGSSEEPQNDKTRKRISGRSKRYTPAENGPYVIPGLSVELFNPAQHSVKSRIIANKIKKGVLNMSNIKLPSSERSLKNSEADDDEINMRTNIQASLANPEDYYSTEDRQLSRHHRRAYSTEFGQRDPLPVRGKSSKTVDYSKDYIYDDDENPFDYVVEDNFAAHIGSEGQDAVQYFQEPGQTFEDVKLTPTMKTNKYENFGELWETKGFANRDEQTPQGQDPKKAFYVRTSPPYLRSYIPYNSHERMWQHPPPRYAKNSFNMWQHYNNDDGKNENDQRYNQKFLTHPAQNNDHEFLLHNTRENTMNGNWRHDGERERIRNLYENNDSEQEKIESNSTDIMGHEINRNENTGIDDKISQPRYDFGKPIAAFIIQTLLGDNPAFPNARNFSHSKENRPKLTLEGITSIKENRPKLILDGITSINEKNDETLEGISSIKENRSKLILEGITSINEKNDKAPRNMMKVNFNRTLASSIEEDGSYTLKKQSEINKMTACQRLLNVSMHGSQTHNTQQDLDSPSATSTTHNLMKVVRGDTNKTTDKQDGNIDIQEFSIEMLEEKKRSPRSVPLEYKQTPITHVLHPTGKQRNYYGRTEPLVPRFEALRKYLSDYDDYDADREAYLEELIFARIHPKQDLLPEILRRGRTVQAFRRPTGLELRPAFERLRPYYEYYRADGANSRLKFKRDEAKQLQEDNSERPNVHSDRRFLNLDVLDYNDKILQLRDTYHSKAQNDDPTVAKISGGLTHSLIEVTNDVGQNEPMQSVTAHELKQSESAEVTSLNENLLFMGTSEGKPSEETNTIKNQTEKIERNSLAHATQIQEIPNIEITTSVTEKITVQEETTTINTHTLDDGNYKSLLKTEGEIQKRFLDMTTEIGEIINQNVTESNTNSSTVLLYGYDEDRVTTVPVTNKTLNNVTKYEPLNTNNLNIEAEKFPSNLDPTYSQTSENFKLSRKRENMNENTFNRIKLPIPKENTESKDTNKEKVPDTNNFSAMQPDKTFTNGHKEQTFLVITSVKEDSMTFDGEDGSDENKKEFPPSTVRNITSDSAKPVDDDPTQSSDETTKKLHEKWSQSAVIENENQTSKVDDTAKESETSPTQPPSSSGDKNAPGSSKETRDMQLKTAPMNEKQLKNTDDSKHLSTQTSGNADVITHASHDGKTTAIESRSLPETTKDTASYDKSAEREVSSGEPRDTSGENQNTATVGTDQDPTNPQTDTHKSLHTEVAGLKEASETQESNPGDGNNDKGEEKKGNFKSGRVIRMQGETPGMRLSLPTLSQSRALPDIAKRREERLRALNERRARIRARLLARAGAGSHERGSASNRRRLREALGQFADEGESTDLNENHFPLHLVSTGYARAEENFNPSLSTETFIERYLLQQKNQMPSTADGMITDRALPSETEDNVHVAGRGYNNDNIKQVKSIHRDTLQLHPRYYHPAPINAYTSYIMNTIQGVPARGSGLEMDKVIPPPDYQAGRENDIDEHTTSQHLTPLDMGRKHRTARESLPLRSNLHYYVHQTNEPLIFSNIGGYPYPSIDERADMPGMFMDYNEHPDDFMIDDLEDYSVYRPGRNAYVVDDHQWPGSSDYDEKLSGNELLPFMFEVHDPDIYEEDDGFDPEHSDEEVIFDASYPYYEGDHVVIPNENVPDGNWDKFLHILEETELEAENETEITKPKNTSNVPAGDTDKHKEELKENVVPEKIYVPTRFRRSVSSGETHEYITTPTETSTTENTHSQQHIVKMPSPNPFKIKFNDIPGLLTILGKSKNTEDADTNAIHKLKPKSLSDQWSTYATGKSRDYRNNIKKIIHHTKPEVSNNRNINIKSNTVGSSNTESNDSKEMSETAKTEEVMRLVFYAYPAGESNDKEEAHEEDKKDELTETVPDFAPLEAPDVRRHDESHRSHLIEDDDDTFRFSDEDDEDDCNIAKHKHTRRQSESDDISLVSVLFQALGTVIKLFKDFKLY